MPEIWWRLKLLGRKYSCSNTEVSCAENFIPKLVHEYNHHHLSFFEKKRGHLLKKNTKEKFNTARILLFMLFISLLITHICKVPSRNQERELTHVFTICFIKG